MRLKALLAVMAVGLGAILTTGGPDEVIQAGRVLLANAGLLILVLAALSLLMTIVPRRALPGPLGLGAVGLSVLAFQRGIWSADFVWPVIGGVLVVVGGWLAMSPTDPVRRRLDPVRRELVAFLPRRIRINNGEETPRHLSVITVGTWARVTFSEGCVPGHKTIELLLTCLGGQVEVKTPDSWPVVAGRVSAARGIRFVGGLDHHRPFPDPSEPGQSEKLRDLIKTHQEKHPPLDLNIPSAVLVIHVAGFGGEAAIVRGGS